MHDILGFGLKTSLSLTSLGWKNFFTKFFQETRAIIFRSTHKFDHLFLRQRMKGGEVGAINFRFESQVSDSIFITEQFVWGEAGKSKN